MLFWISKLNEQSRPPASELTVSIDFYARQMKVNADVLKRILFLMLYFVVIGGYLGINQQRDK